MKVYFLSCTPCALSVNGAYFGIVNDFEKFISAHLSDELFITLTPQNGCPVSFFLREDICFSPPENCEIYLLKDGIAIYVSHFPPSDCSLQAICQQKRENITATVYKQGEVFLSIHDGKNLFISTLPPSFCVCELFFEEKLLLLRSPTQVGVFSQTAERILLESAQDFQLENQILSLRIPLSDRLGRYANCRWRIEEDQLVQTERTLLQRSENDDTPPDDLLAYALFESVLLNIDYAHLLSENLQQEKDKLRAYLGNFISISPTLSPNVCALVYKKAERLFDVREYAVDINNGKIENVSLL